MYSSCHSPSPTLRPYHQSSAIYKRPQSNDRDKPKMLRMALPRPAVLFITPDGFCSDEAAAVKLAKEALKGGVGLVQIRDRLASAELLHAVISALTRELGGTDRFVVNGPHALDVAMSIPGIGVHVREASIASETTDACSFVSNGGVVGCSVHSVQAAAEAVKHGPPDYIQVGTMFETRSHPGKVPEGPDLVRSVREVVGPSCMLIGVGGITAENATTLIECGADGVAIISGIAGAANPSEAAAGIKRSLEAAVST